MFHPRLLSLSLVQLLLTSAFDINAKDNVAVYWGQASAGTQESLGTYCASDNVDVVVLSFLYQFPDNLAIDFASACSTTFDDGLLHCPSIAADIESCQAKGKKVFLSLGGAIGSYGFTDDSQAEEFATTLWNTFGEGTADNVERPFDTAVVDGFDFDIENNNPTGYASLATKLRSLYAKGSKDYYLAAAPQCVYPDASVGDALANADIDIAFVQFYNNYCNVDKQFNWDTWADFVENTSPNKDIKLYLGSPGAASAAGSGYISDLSLLKSTVQTIGENSHFGGIMLWDASQGFTNQVDGEPYVAQVKSILEANTDSTSSQSATSSVQSSSSTATTPDSTLITSTSSKASSISQISSTTQQGVEPTTTSGSTSSPDSISSTTTISSTKTVVNGKVSIASSTDVTTSQQAVTQSTAISVTSSTEVTTSQQPTTKSTTTLQPTTTAAPTTIPEPSRTTLQPSTTQSSDSTQSTDSWAVTRAKELNEQFVKGELNGKDSCSDGEISCTADGKIAICNYGAWVYTECAAGTTCFAYDSGDSVYTSCNFTYLKPDVVF